MPEKKKAFYSQTPVLTTKKKKPIADTNPVGSVELGSAQPMMAPHHPARTKAFGPAWKQPHGYGHTLKKRKGHLRISGHPGAHQIGYHAPKVTKVPK